MAHVRLRCPDCGARNMVSGETTQAILAEIDRLGWDVLPHDGACVSATCPECLSARDDSCLGEPE